MSANLASLSIGEGAEVQGIDGEDGVAIRLLEMGFVPGTHVELVKAAPLGDPLEFQIRGYHVSLRKAEATRVQVKRS